MKAMKKRFIINLCIIITGCVISGCVVKDKLIEEHHTYVVNQTDSLLNIKLLTLSTIDPSVSYDTTFLIQPQSPAILTTIDELWTNQIFSILIFSSFNDSILLLENEDIIWDNIKTDLSIPEEDVWHYVYNRYFYINPDMITY